MKIVFMGTPEFARRPLEYLAKNTRHELLAVVTGPDKPVGRGRKLQSTAVKSAGLNLNLPIFTPDSLKDANFINQMRKIGADIFVVVAFRILPEELFTLPKFGSINVHGSLLPKYRGAAPINWAIINGETETGLTTFFLKKKVDTGNIIYQEKTDIAPNETYNDLYLKLSNLAGPVIEKTLALIETGEVKEFAQDNSLATPAPKIKPEDCRIDWSLSATECINFIRGMSSIPGAFTYFRGKKLKIFRALKMDLESDANYESGQIISDKKRLIVAAKDGNIEILQLLPEGKSKITGGEFIRGYQPKDGESLGPIDTKNLEQT
jgi:methionyl-tRNA formyltransferase